jgi:hypothetical protein
MDARCFSFAIFFSILGIKVQNLIENAEKFRRNSYLWGQNGWNMDKSKIICRTAVGLMLLVVFYVIMINAHWTLGDDIQILNTTAIGKHFHFWIGRGRFPPLGNYDFNILNYIPYGYTVNAHFMINALCFTLTILTLAVLFKNKQNEKAEHRYINAFFLVTFPAMLSDSVQVFVDVIYPERLMCLTLALFMLWYKKALESKKTGYYMLAFLAAAFTTYCKEPIFGALLIIVFVNLIFSRKGDEKPDKKERIFYFSLILNAIVFLILWYFLSYRGVEPDEMYGQDLVIEHAMLRKGLFFVKCYIFIPMFLLGGFRAYQVLFKKDRTSLYYDSLLFSGIGYTIAMLCFHFSVLTYYYIPAFMLMLPGFVHWVNEWFVCKKKSGYIVLIALFLLAVGWAPIRMTKSVSRHYTTAFITNNGIRKLDQYLDNGRRVVWLNEPEVITYVHQGEGKIETFLNYLHTKDIGKKPFVTAEDRTYSYSDVIEDGSVDDEVDENVVYISFRSDLPVHDKRFANFVPVFEIDSWEKIFTAYALKKGSTK